MLASFALSCTASASEPDAKNSLPIRANPTATVSAVCLKLDQEEYPQLVHANCFSERKQAVTVLVSGNADGMTGQLIAEYIVAEFQKTYVPSVVFLDMPDWDGVTITYLLNGDAYGPYSGNNWRKGLKLLTKHSAQAWYQN